MENQYIKQFPELMSGKTILYVHGFGSSGQSGTVVRLREVLPNAHVVAPDLPLHPEEAMVLLHDTCKKEQPSLIIGTSMGGMYAEMLYGYDCYLNWKKWFNLDLAEGYSLFSTLHVLLLEKQLVYLLQSCYFFFPLHA